MESFFKTSENWPLCSWHGALINIFKNYKTIADDIIKMGTEPILLLFHSKLNRVKHTYVIYWPMNSAYSKTDP